MATPKKLYKDKERAVVSGVLAGFSDYANIDLSLVRVLFVIFFLFSGVGGLLIVYIVMAIVLPDKSEVVYENVYETPKQKEEEDEYAFDPNDYKV